MSHLLTTWFKHRLGKLGYPTDNVCYSLGYCQGDGMAFYGYLDLSVIGPRLVPDMPKSVWEFMGRSVEIEDRNIRYHHWNSMYLPHDSDDIAEEEPEEFGGIVKRVAMYKLMEALEDDIKSTSRKLEEEGYALIEGTPCEDEVILEKSTRKFVVKVTKFRDEHFSIDCDEEYIEEEYQSIITGDVTYFGLKAEIFAKADEDDDEGTLIAEHALWGITAKDGDKYMAECTREIVREAICEARQLLGFHTEPKQLALAA